MNVKMGIFGKAERKDTAEAYREMYKKYAELTYDQVSDLLIDAKGALETKVVLGQDTSGMNPRQLIALMEIAKQIGLLAILPEMHQEASNIKDRYRSLTKKRLGD